VKTELKNVKKEDDGDVIMESIKIKSKNDNIESRNISANKTAQSHDIATPSFHHSSNSQYIKSTSYNPSCHSSVTPSYHTSSVSDNSSTISKPYSTDSLGSSKSSTTSHYFSSPSRNPSNQSRHSSTVSSSSFNAHSSTHRSSTSSNSLTGMSAKNDTVSKTIHLMRTSKMMPKNRSKIASTISKPRKPQVHIPKHIKELDSSNTLSNFLTSRNSSNILSHSESDIKKKINTLKSLSVSSSGKNDLNTKASSTSFNKKIKLSNEKNDLNRLNNKKYDLISLDDPEENTKNNNNDIMDID